MVQAATNAEPLVIGPQPGPQWDFAESLADVAIYGGAAGGGKTFAALLEPLKHIDVPKFRALILRRTTKEVTEPGALWDEASDLYPHLQADLRVGDLSCRFPAGAVVKFDHMEHEKDKFRYQGAQIPLIEFEELTHFTESQFWYMLSRNRSTCGVRPYVRATCNPDADSWVAKLIEWWIDQDTGLPIPERSGVVRWFVRVSGELVWGDSREELLAEHPTSHPKSLTFIAATLEDNRALLDKDPQYLANLEALPYVDRARLRDGNWKVRSNEGAEWGDECFEDLWPDFWPGAFELGAIAIDPSKGKTDHSDYAAIVFVGLAGRKLWVDATIARMPSDRIAAEAIELYREHLPQVVGMEDNANQDLAFGRLVEQEAAERGLPPLPMCYFSNTERKERRIFHLNPYMKAKQFRFRSNSAGCRLLESQLRGFPLKDVHDDGPDALEMAVRLLNELAVGERNTATEELIEA